MKNWRKNLLRLSLTINAIFAVILITMYSSISELKEKSREYAEKAELLEVQALEAQKVAQEQAALAERQMIRARIAQQKALANDFKEKSEAQ